MDLHFPSNWVSNCNWNSSNEWCIFYTSKEKFHFKSHAGYAPTYGQPIAQCQTVHLHWHGYVSQAGSTESAVTVSLSVQQALVSKCGMSGWGCTSLSLPDRKTMFYQPYFFPSMVPEFTVMKSTEAHNVWCFFKVVLRYSEGRILDVKMTLSMKRK